MPKVIVDAVRDVVREEIQQALGNLSGPKLDVQAIRGIVQDALANVSLIPVNVPNVVGSNVLSTTVTAAEPVFIPSGIVPSGAGTAINIAPETSTASSVDDAAAALKAARTPRKKNQE